MRAYYFCMANYIIYTEREMKASDFPPSRFLPIGRHKNRQEAEEAFTEAYPEWDVCSDKPW